MKLGDCPGEPSHAYRASVLRLAMNSNDPVDDLLSLASRLVQRGKTVEAVFVFKLLSSVERHGPEALGGWRLKLEAEQPWGFAWSTPGTLTERRKIAGAAIELSDQARIIDEITGVVGPTGGRPWGSLGRPGAAV